MESSNCRVGSIHTSIEYGMAAPGALLGGVLAARLGHTAPFWLGAVTGLALLPYVRGVFSAQSVALARRNAAESTSCVIVEGLVRGS